MLFTTGSRQLALEKSIFSVAVRWFYRFSFPWYIGISQYMTLKWPWPWKFVRKCVRLIEPFKKVIGFIFLWLTVCELRRKNGKMPSGHLGMTLTLNPYLPKGASRWVLSDCRRFYCSITNGLGVIEEKPEKWPFMPSGDGSMTFYAKMYITTRCASSSSFVFTPVLFL